MSSYLAFVPVLLVCAAVVYVPGVIIGFALRLRGLWFFAAAPVFGLTAVAAAAVVAPLVGMSWGALPVALVAVTAGVVIALLTWFVPRLRPQSSTRTSPWPIIAGLSVGALLIAWQLARATGGPAAVSQSYDNVFHLNAVRWVMETHSASPFTLGRMTSPEGAIGFYPSAWHGLVAIVAELSGAGIPVAINAVTFVGACLIWPLGGILLARTLFGRSAAVTIAAGVLAAAFPTFPLLLLSYGVLYPMFLAYAAVPVALAALIRLVGAWRIKDGVTRWAAALILLGVLPGIAVTHPGAIVAILAFSVPVVVVGAVRAFASAPGRRGVWLLSGALVVYVIAGAVALQILRPPVNQIYWPIAESPGQAVGEFLTASVYFMPMAVVVAALSIAGVVVAVKRRSPAGWTAVGLWAMAGVLYIIVAASPSELVRLIITGPWYNNIPRLAALYPIVAAPLAALGASVVWEVLQNLWRRKREPARALSAALAVVTVALLAVCTQGQAMSTAVGQARSVYALSDDSWMLTPDELAMFERVEEIVPAGETIGGNPWTGAGLAFAFTGRPVLMPHLLMDISPDLEEFLDGFSTAQAGDDVCAATDRLDVRWILDFGDQQINNSHQDYPGLDDLSASSNAELVDQIGDASLYRITGCGING